MKERTFEHNLCLSQEEALGLLEIAMTSPGDLTPEQRSAIVKLSDFCRECLRNEVADRHDLTSRGVERPFTAAFAA